MCICIHTHEGGTFAQQLRDSKESEERRVEDVGKVKRATRSLVMWILDSVVLTGRTNSAALRNTQQREFPLN